MRAFDTFAIEKNGIFSVPIMHYKMEFAAQVHQAYHKIQPDCVAVELAETLQLQLLHAASRLPDISLVITYGSNNQPLYYMCEPCDGCFEALRSAIENQIPAFCIDLDVDDYPEVVEALPDPYAIERIGLKEYYKIYQKMILAKGYAKQKVDQDRELFMARRLKELSLSYDRILFVGGMSHVENVLKEMERAHFPEVRHFERNTIELCTLTEKSCRDVLSEFGYISEQYELSRLEYSDHICKGKNPSDIAFPPDRQKLIFQLYKASSEAYKANDQIEFPGYHFRNLMKFVRNYSLIYHRLMPDLYQILIAAKGCVDHNYAYETWERATNYPYLRNWDNLPELNLSPEEVWGHSKIIRFTLKQPRRKGLNFTRKRQDKSQFSFTPPGPLGICSYQPEDIIVERFGEFLKQKGTQIYSEEAARTIPFSTSLEDGIDTRETIRHWFEKKIYVKVKGKPPGGVGSIVVIFDEDSPEETELRKEKFPWRTTWLGEHEQESDMAFYATQMGSDLVGPGISRCRYGGFMMSYPPRRILDVWQDPDYQACRSKPETLLVAAIDYAIKPIVVYVAAKPPRDALKRFAERFGKKIIVIPIGQLSPITLRKIQTFHVLDGHDKRTIADEYIL